MSQYVRKQSLDEADLLPDPLAQLDRWLKDAADAGMLEPTAMTLATVGADGKPTARMVLFKGMDDGGLTFYTHYESNKARELAGNPNVALVFWWDRLERQVRVEGHVEKLPEATSQRYFHSRPRDSQIGAYTSRQSREVASRAELDARMEENARRFAGQPVPYPAYWGGYCVRPVLFEFWQGRRGRLHDRLVYSPSGEGWRIVRLEP